jgi:hypothetical protein
MERMTGVVTAKAPREMKRNATTAGMIRTDLIGQIIMKSSVNGRVAELLAYESHNPTTARWLPQQASAAAESFVVPRV